MRLITDIQPDTERFRWHDSDKDLSLYPAAVCRLNSKYYLLNRFGRENKEYIEFLPENTAEALRTSIELAGEKELGVLEASNIYQIIKKEDLNINDFPVFKNLGIKGKNAFNMLEAVYNFDIVIKNYIENKKPALKILNVLSKLENNLLNVIKEFIQQKTPSVQSFRNAVNFLYDHRPDIDSFSEDIFVLEKNSENPHEKFKEKWEILSRKLPIIAESECNFETSELIFKIKASDSKEFNEKLKKTQENTDVIEEMYRLLEDI